MSLSDLEWAGGLGSTVDSNPMSWSAGGEAVELTPISGKGQDCGGVEGKDCGWTGLVRGSGRSARHRGFSWRQDMILALLMDLFVLWEN